MTRPQRERQLEKLGDKLMAAYAKEKQAQPAFETEKTRLQGIIAALEAQERQLKERRAVYADELHTRQGKQCELAQRVEDAVEAIQNFIRE